MFVHLPRGRNDDGVELQERRLPVVNVPFTQGKPVSRSFFHFGCLTLMEPHRGTTQWDNYGGRKRKRKRKQGMPRMRRTRRTRQMFLRVAHGPPRAAPHSSLAERPRPRHLQKCMPLSPRYPPHMLLLLRLQPPRRPPSLTR